MKVWSRVWRAGGAPYLEWATTRSACRMVEAMRPES